MNCVPQRISSRASSTPFSMLGRSSRFNMPTQEAVPSKSSAADRPVVICGSSTASVYASVVAPEKRDTALEQNAQSESNSASGAAKSTASSTSPEDKLNSTTSDLTQGGSSSAQRNSRVPKVTQPVVSVNPLVDEPVPVNSSPNPAAQVNESHGSGLQQHSSSEERSDRNCISPAKAMRRDLDLPTDLPIITVTKSSTLAATDGKGAGVGDSGNPSCTMGLPLSQTRPLRQIQDSSWQGHASSAERISKAMPTNCKNQPIHTEKIPKIREGYYNIQNETLNDDGAILCTVSWCGDKPADIMDEWPWLTLGDDTGIPDNNIALEHIVAELPWLVPDPHYHVNLTTPLLTVSWQSPREQGQHRSVTITKDLLASSYVGGTPLVLHQKISHLSQLEAIFKGLVAHN